MRYLSFFSGIGGFEVAIEKRYKGDVTCLGYSEVDKKAISIYTENFPNHPSLGDIREISDDKIKVVTKGGCDLIVGGFPCQNLTSYGYTRNVGTGLEGEKSGLFYELLRIIKETLRQNPGVDIILENNASMRNSEREKITEALQKVFRRRRVYVEKIDAGDMGVQTRKRLFWTTFPVEQPKRRIQAWNNVLDPVSSESTFQVMSEDLISYLNAPCSLNKNYSKAKVRVMKNKGGESYRFVKNDVATRWYLQVSNTSDRNSKPLVRGHSYLNDGRGLLDGNFVPRHYNQKEMCRLFGFPVKFGKGLSRNQAIMLFGNCVVVHVVDHILGFRI